uniref:Fibrinogen C-terminal domain-containing protein n=1 Tax=Anopheles culicifacies TaxID=139723 RepID=A0A182MJV9_9DIPT
MQTLSVLVVLLFYCNIAKVRGAQTQTVTNRQIPQTGFGFELISAKLNMFEHLIIEQQLQTEDKLTVLSGRVENLIKTVVNLAWSVHNTEQIVHQLNLYGKHLQYNATVIQRDLDLLLAGQKRLLSTHQFGEYLLQLKGCNFSSALSINDDRYQIYRSCNKIPLQQSGVYRIRPNKSFNESIKVLCDQEYDLGGWIVIQHRVNGSVDFYRKWNEYKEGFGENEGEFWLGLDHIHQLTTSVPHELVILLEDFAGNRTFARYAQFQIGSEAQKYMLTKIDGYTGTAGDSLSDLRGRAFSTHDADNDRAKENCAVTNLNGKYLRGETKEYATGMVWKTFRGFHYSLKSSKMMIRPK